jgi:3-hydroxyacyl-CoA dehydrogenase
LLVAQGASVALFDVIDAAKGDAFAQQVSNDNKAKYYRVDITDSDAVKAAVEDVVKSYGNLKGCVHCAGVAIKRPWTNDVSESIPNFKKVSLPAGGRRVCLFYPVTEPMPGGMRRAGGSSTRTS